MKATLLITSLLLFNFLTPATNPLPAFNETRDVSDFTAIEVHNAIEVEVKNGNYSLRLEGEQKWVSKVETTVEKGVLKINVAKGVKKMEKVKVLLSTPELNAVDAHSASSIVFIDEFETADFQIGLSSASRGEIKVKSSGNVNINCSGASRLALEGSAPAVDVDLSGASVFRASNFKVGNMTLGASGASMAEVTVENELQVEASGASKVRYTKGTRSVKPTVSGAASLKEI